MAHWDARRELWRITAEGGTTPAGKRQRMVRHVREPNDRAGRRRAENLEGKLRAELEESAGQWWRSTDKAPTFEAVAESWMSSKRESWSPATLRLTRRCLALHVLPTLGRKRVDEITPQLVEALYESWYEAGLAKATRRRMHSMVSAVFKSAAHKQPSLAAANPMPAVTPAGGKAPERPIPTPADVAATLDEAGPALATFLELAIATGARRGTLCALRWSDVDLESGRIVFTRAITIGQEDGREKHYEKTTKANKPYSCAIKGRTLEALRTHYSRSAESALALGLVSRLETLFVFSSDGGLKHWGPEWASRGTLRAQQRAGVVNTFRLHDLRHFAATHMLLSGLPTRVVAQRLGCTEQNVITTYSHWIPSTEDDRAADVMAGALG